MILNSRTHSNPAPFDFNMAIWCSAMCDQDIFMACDSGTVCYNHDFHHRERENERKLLLQNNLVELEL